MNTPLIIFAGYVLIVGSQVSPTPSTPSPTIVFVCEHGALKSVVASAYFNKLAAERGLPYRATFRGASPQADLSQRAIEGLRADGLEVPTGKPTAVDQTDVDAATHIFAIGCALPDIARKSGKATDWSDVPDDRGYAGMRDAIVRHVVELLDELGKPQYGCQLSPAPVDEQQASRQADS
jgi:arsenate reductase